MALLLFRRTVMQCVKSVTPHTSDQMPFECESARPGPDLDDDASDSPDDDNDSDVHEEAGYGYGV
jgi:hypothetical protein